MIDKKTVFVLGAGASCPYGYPSGAQLRKEICESPGIDQFFCRHLNQSEMEKSGSMRREDLKKFAESFFNSSTRSIDLFMARNPHWANAGKYAIALAIFDAERKSDFREKAKEGEDWYFHLFDRLTNTITNGKNLCAFSKNKISFITFNYDRSLEQFLYESLINSFGQVSEEKVIEQLNGIKIIHLYGEIAALTWQDTKNGVGYKHEITHNLLARCKENLKTIYEESENLGLNEAQELIKEAEQIFVLGFGYAKENMDILRFPDIIGPYTSSLSRLLM